MNCLEQLLYNSHIPLYFIINGGITRESIQSGVAALHRRHQTRRATPQHPQKEQILPSRPSPLPQQHVRPIHAPPNMHRTQTLVLSIQSNTSFYCRVCKSSKDKSMAIVSKISNRVCCWHFSICLQNCQKLSDRAW